MPEPDDLETRVSAVEEQVRDLQTRLRSTERDATAARVLAGGADRDVGELGREMRDFRQATAASFTAMRADLVDLRGDFGAQLAVIRVQLDAAAAGQQQIVELLTTLIDREH